MSAWSPFDPGSSSDMICLGVVEVDVDQLRRAGVAFQPGHDDLDAFVAATGQVDGKGYAFVRYENSPEEGFELWAEEGADFETVSQAVGGLPQPLWQPDGEAGAEGSPRGDDSG